MATVKYPYDPSGVLATNLIENEMRSVQPPANISQASLIIPVAAPFFVEGFEIYTAANKGGKKLVEGKDYFITHQFVAGTMVTGKPIAGGICFTNSLYTGNVYLHYQTLGGEFVINDSALLESISKSLYADVRFVRWDQLTGVPSSYPPNAHHQSVTRIVTFEDIQGELEKIAIALISAGASTGGTGNSDTLIRAHMAATTGAHTPGAVGLANVANYPLATPEEALNLGSDRYMSPSTTAYLFRNLIAKEDLTEMRDNITELQEFSENVVTALQQINSAINAINKNIEAINNDINLWRKELANLSTTVEQNQETSLTALTIANQALSTASAAQANVEIAYGEVTDVLYTGNALLNVGTHDIALPPGTAMLITLIGGGGGSGKWYQNSTQAVQLASAITDGGDSVLYYLGSKLVPVEPVPLLLAGGGNAGLSAYGEIGAIQAGMGGRAMRLTGDRVNVSTINAISLDTPYTLGAVETNGVDGRAGDTSTLYSKVDGVGGWYVDASGDGTRRKYGRGATGVTRAGGGGSGAKWQVIVENDTAHNALFSIVVGKGGCSARAIANEERDSAINRNTTDGVAIITLVV